MSFSFNTVNFVGGKVHNNVHFNNYPPPQPQTQSEPDSDSDSDSAESPNVLVNFAKMPNITGKINVCDGDMVTVNGVPRPNPNMKTYTSDDAPSETSTKNGKVLIRFGK